ncbi:MAG TPA: TIGR03000 domain-containing protein [Gemmataceae bacterium]|nr:TIGR03000 domain-containing protein [Gemmataceae bacterium]
MYSVVLAAALTTGVSAPDCWFRHGCHGCYGGWGCHGCYGCYGGWVCHGCYGGWWCNGCFGCYGGWACHGCYGGIYAPMYYAPAAPPAGAPPAPEPAPKPKLEEKTALPSKARLIVELPADAKLYIDDQLMKTTSARRVFNTPPLEPGQGYYYILRAEIVRDGKTYTDTKQVVVRAGAEVQANFHDLELAAVRATPETTARR